MSEQKFKKPGEGDDDFDAGFTIPSTKKVLTSLQEELYTQHQQQAQEEEEAEKQGKGKKARQKPKGGTVCICGHPSCRIGGFIEKQGEQ